MAIVGIIFSLLIGTLFILDTPKNNYALEHNYWCIDRLYIDGNEVNPHTVDEIIFQIAGYRCKEYIEFNENGWVSFPGVNSSRYKGFWVKDADSVIISDQYNSQNYFSTEQNTQLIDSGKVRNSFYGRYKLERDGNDILLQSNDIIIVAHSNEIAKVFY